MKPETNNLILSPSELYRLNYEEHGDDHWSDIDALVRIFKLDDGLYQQYVLDENDNEVVIGIALKTVADLQNRFLSITGLELKRWNEDRPQTGQ